MTITFRAKSLLLSIVPLLLVSTGILLFVNYSAESTKERNLTALRQTMMEAKRQGLKEQVQLAVSSIERFIDAGLSDSEAKQRATEILMTLRYGDNRDGYFSAYTDDATIAMHPIKPEIVGKDFSHVKDRNGVVLVPAMVESARSGDGFVTYLWEKPSLKREVQKLAYAQRIDALSWTIMTGIYIDDVDTLVAVKREEADKDTRSQMLNIFILCSLVILLTVVICWYAVSLTVKPLVEVLDALTEISHGDGDLTKRIEVKTTDEIGKLAEEFNTFASTISILVCSVADNANGIGRAAGDLKDITQRTSHHLKQQEKETQMAVTAVTEMSQTSAEVAQRTAEAAEAAQDASSNAYSGGEVIAGVVDSIHELASHIKGTTEAAEGLKSETQGIADISNIISGIADMTNLLALNAAIESARAGEHGRGFAVVADEVRSLARKTQESTESIITMIESLQREADAVVTAMEKSQGYSDRSVERIQEAGQRFEAIAKSVGTISDMNTQVATAVEEQATVADEIAENMTRIFDISLDTAKESQSIADSSCDLSDSGERLVELVQQFKI